MIWTMTSFGGEPDMETHIKSRVESAMAINCRHPGGADLAIVNRGNASQQFM